MLGPHDLEEFYEITEEGQPKAVRLPRLKLAAALRALQPRKREVVRHTEETRAV